MFQWLGCYGKLFLPTCGKMMGKVTTPTLLSPTGGEGQGEGASPYTFVPVKARSAVQIGTESRARFGEVHGVQIGQRARPPDCSFGLFEDAALVLLFKR